MCCYGCNGTVRTLGRVVTDELRRGSISLSYQGTLLLLIISTCTREWKLLAETHSPSIPLSTGDTQTSAHNVRIWCCYTYTLLQHVHGAATPTRCCHSYTVLLYIHGAAICTWCCYAFTVLPRVHGATTRTQCYYT